MHPGYTHFIFRRTPLLFGMPQWALCRQPLRFLTERKCSAKFRQEKITFRQGMNLLYLIIKFCRVYILHFVIILQ